MFLKKYSDSGKALNKHKKMYTAGTETDKYVSVFVYTEWVRGYQKLFVFSQKVVKK